jgi:hypothetical protein
MKTLLLLPIVLLAGCASPEFPTYFKYHPTGGVFLRQPDSPKARIEWMLSRQADPSIVGLARSMELRTTGKLDPQHGPCYLRANAILEGVKGHPGLGTFRRVTGAVPWSKDHHAFVAWTDPSGDTYALDTTASPPLQPLTTYLEGFWQHGTSL